MHRGELLSERCETSKLRPWTDARKPTPLMRTIATRATIVRAATGVMLNLRLRDDGI